MTIRPNMLPLASSTTTTTGHVTSSSTTCMLTMPRTWPNKTNRNNMFPNKITTFHKSKTANNTTMLIKLSSNNNNNFELSNQSLLIIFLVKISRRKLKAAVTQTTMSKTESKLKGQMLVCLRIIKGLLNTVELEFLMKKFSVNISSTPWKHQRV